MNDARSIWTRLRNECSGRIELRCKNCRPRPTSSGCGGENSCEHEEKGIWVVREDFEGEQDHWTFVREIPTKRTDRLCTKKNCQGGRRCGGAHGDAELRVWKELERSQQHLHSFLPSLLYYEEENAKAVEPPIAQPAKKARKHRIPANNRIRNHGRRERYQAERRRFESVLKECGGGRFLFACNDCYNLEPCIVKEMEVGSEKDPVLVCKWCNGKKHVLLHEVIQQNENGVNFCEYQAVRERLSTSRGTSLCRMVLNCSTPDICTFAHSWLEFQVWRLEADGESRLELVRYCNKDTNEARRDLLNGVFYCDRCCLSFADHREYTKFMGHNHSSNHFPRIARQANGWVFRPFRRTDPLTLFRYQECQQVECTHAHVQSELEEWNKRVQIVRERAGFQLKEIPKSERFNFKQRPE